MYGNRAFLANLTVCINLYVQFYMCEIKIYTNNEYTQYTYVLNDRNDIITLYSVPARHLDLSKHLYKKHDLRPTRLFLAYRIRSPPHPPAPPDYFTHAACFNIKPI